MTFSSPDFTRQSNIFYCYTCLLFILFAVSTQSLRAQVYPVEVMPIVAYPYPAFLNDYAREDLTVQRLQVNLLMRDLSQAHRRVRLKVYVEGPGISVAGSDMPQGVEPLYLDGGILLRLTNAQLAPYFKLENLPGLSPQVYASPLRAGLYTFGFEVYDFATSNRLSAKRLAPVQIVYNLPPLLNLPATGSEVSSAFPQNVMFNWAPRHMDISNTEYEFTLVELNDPILTGEAAFMNTPPFYQQTTMASALVYGTAMPPLVQGKRYAWRVQVKPRMGATYTQVFENDGYSPVFTFTYEAATPAPIHLTATPRERYTALATWQGQPGHTSYTIELRQKPGQEGGNSNWYTYTVTDTQYLFRNLRPGYTYECRVTGYRNEHNHATSETAEFTTPAMNPPKFEGCGTTAQTETITNRTPLEHLLVGDVFTANQTPVTVTTIKQSSGGAFSGYGWMNLPFLGNIRVAVVFNDIMVNTDYQMVAGVVETTYDPTGSGIINVNDAIKQLAEDLATTFNELADAVSKRIDNFIATFEKEGVTSARLDSLNTIVPKNIDKLITNAPEETKGLLEQAKQAYNEYYSCLDEQVKSSTPEPQPANKTKGPNPYGYMEMTGGTPSCSEKGKQAASLIEKAAAYTSNTMVCGCLTSSPTTTINPNCSGILKILNALKAANSANQEVKLTKSSPAIQSAPVSIGKTCFTNITVDMSLISANNVSFSPSSYSVKQVGLLPENDWAIVYDKILSIKIPSTVKNAEEQIRQLELYLFGTNKAAVTITGTQLAQIFTGTSQARCNEVAALINKYSDKFEINTTERMAHFLGQIGAETTNLTALVESCDYPESTIKGDFARRTAKPDISTNGKTFRPLLNPELFDEINSGSGYYFRVTDNGDIIKDSIYYLPVAVYDKTTLRYSYSNKNIKNQYLNGNQNCALFNYVYCCNKSGLGNGSVASGDGALFRGRGFIQLTGRYNYTNSFYNPWKHEFPTDTRTIEQLVPLLETDVDLAIKASMVFWKDKKINQSINNSTFDGNNDDIREVSLLVNGGKKDLKKENIKGYPLRETNTINAYKVLNKN